MKRILYALLIVLIASTCFGFGGRGIEGTNNIIPLGAQEPITVNGELRAIKYYNSAGTVTRVDIFYDAAVADYGAAATVGSIAWAMSLFPTTQGAVGGMIHIGSGTFPIATKLTVNHTNLDIGGEGDSTQIYVSNGANLDAVFHYYSPDNTHKYYFLNIHDLHIEGNKANQASGTNYGIWISVGSGGQANDYKIERVFVQNMKGSCIQSDYTWGARINNCLLETCGGDGLYVVGTGNSFFTNIFSAYNGLTGYTFTYTDKNVISGLSALLNVGAGLFIGGNNNVVNNIILYDNCTTGAGCAQLWLTNGAGSTGKSRLANIEIGKNTSSPAFGTLIQGSGGEIEGLRCEGQGSTADVYVDGGGTDTIIKNSKFTTYANTGTTRWEGNKPIIYTAATPTLLAGGTAYIDTSTRDVAATLGSATVVGQEITIILTEATSAADGGTTVSVTNHETSDPEVCTFTAVGMMWKLMWNGAKWVTIKSTCTL